MALGVVLNMDGQTIFNGLMVVMAAVTLWRTIKVGKNKELSDKLEKKVDDSEFVSLKDKVVSNKVETDKEIKLIRKEMDGKVGKDVVIEIKHQFEFINKSLTTLIKEGNAAVLSAVEQQGKRIDAVENRLNKTG